MYTDIILSPSIRRPTAFQSGTVSRTPYCFTDADPPSDKRFRRRRIPTPEVLRVQYRPPPISNVGEDGDGGDGGGGGAKRAHATLFAGVFSRAVVTSQYFRDCPSTAVCDETLIIYVWRARRAVPVGGRNGIHVGLHPC
jgi:hypothetical protein